MRDVIERLEERSGAVLPSDESGNSRLYGQYGDVLIKLRDAKSALQKVSLSASDFDGAASHKKAVSQQKVQVKTIDGLIEKIREIYSHLSGI